MKNIFIEELAYGEEKAIKLNGNYLKTLARAVEGGQPIANAEIMLMTDGSEETTEIRLLYAENGTMSDYIFFNMNAYLHNNADLIDIIPFNYVKDEITKTGVIIVAKVAVNAPTTNSNLAKAFK